MNRTIIVVIVVVLIVCVCLIAVAIRGRQKEFEMTTVSVSPNIDLREPQTGRIVSVGEKEKEALLKSLEGSSVTGEIAVQAPSEAESPPDKEVNELEILLAKTSQWVYREFIELGDEKLGKIQNHETNELWQVQEGEVYNDVVISRLTYNTCAVALGDASRAIPLTPPLEIPRDEIFKGPPAQEDIEKRVKYYKDFIQPTFEAMASKYTPGPHETMPVPLSEEEIAKNVEHYMKHIAPTFAERAKHYTPKPGEIMPRQPANEDEIRHNKMRYVATYHPEQMPTYPEWDSYFKQKEEYDRQYGTQETPSPEMNTSPTDYAE